MLKVEFINPFIEAAFEIFESEVGMAIEKGNLSVHTTSQTSQDINVMVGVTGSIRGQIIYGMEEKTAKKIAGEMIGQPVPLFDELAQSAIGELGNMITGLASTKLEATGYPSALTPPTIIQGKNVIISTLDAQRIYLVVKSHLGDIEISIALRESSKSN
ncbi:MAG: chemotaxis protein CheX [Actinomycetota bacterium]|nr:chemotaxis protein CheX [Actinomycetota bacterium]